MSAAPATLEDEIAAAVAALRAGAVVAYPTETFYGLAVDPGNPAALERLRLLKGRGVEKAFTLIVANEGMLPGLCGELSGRARALIAAHWPGPLTLALPAAPGLQPAVVLDGFVAVRASPHPVARALSSAFGGAITATSANRAGEPATTTAAEVRAIFGDDGCLVLDGGATPGGAASTLVRVRGDALDVLRPGPITVT